MTTDAAGAAVAAALAALLLMRPRPSLRTGRPTRHLRRSQGSTPTPLARDVPLAADLVVAALEAGMPLWAAVEAVGHAIGGDLGQMLVDVRRRQRSGADAQSSTALLAADPAVARVGRAIARAGSSGASPVHVLATAADSERSRLRSAAVAKARTAGSMAALPVGLLFLPAFVLVAVVPVVVGSVSLLLGSQ